MNNYPKPPTIKKDVRTMRGCWAPGNYYNKCSNFGQPFEGGKHAIV